ncbi:hypothetical protein CY34DRAFT_803991 [Suillus luteus UH-Slu-Lm8-n1]|uniref:Uncharacterized protein n=1 Tax=Suillus luteus UH-Slu-Lm8-n1 TaxID=930992 RepID=A0A0D0AZP9_9AGAM|nr:hypothetical protein CY34DRAFT_803991 [Suillus luteus UH-Slu-Lm8-n1]
MFDHYDDPSHQLTFQASYRRPPHSAKPPDARIHHTTWMWHQLGGYYSLEIQEISPL